MAIQHVTYFILSREAGKVKIGQCRETNPPVKRLKALQTGSPEYLEVLLLLPHKPPFEEIQMHRRFSQYRIQGEWFDYRGELKSFIESKIQDPTPTVEDDLRSFNGCVQSTTKPDFPVFGSDRDQKSYQLYVEYCQGVGCSPAPYEKWLKISYIPVEYTNLTEFVCIEGYRFIRNRDNRKGVTGNPNTSRAHTGTPYERWESPNA